MKTIIELVESLTPEERELHAELIDECIEREAFIEKTSAKMQCDVERLHEAIQKLLSNIEKMYKLSTSLKEICDKTHNRLNSYYLSTLPDEYFFHA